MKPGRPLVLGRVSGTPLIGLPGNPVAAFVSAIQFVRPVIMTMCGRLDLQPPVVPTRVAEPIANPGGKRAFIRVRIERTENGLVGYLAGPQNAANLLTLSRADGLLVIPEAMNQVPAGAVLPVQLLADL
jgi:molybdopterin molybdotransferase